MIEKMLTGAREMRQAGSVTMKGQASVNWPININALGGAKMPSPIRQDTTSAAFASEIPTSVYRYYDAAGVLLYVGITKTGMLRNRQHSSGKVWWQWVSYQAVDHFPSRLAAHAREIELIQKHEPPFNTQHNPRHAALSSIYLSMRKRGEFDQPAPVEVVRDNVALELLEQTRAVCRWKTHPFDAHLLKGVTYSREARPPVLSGDRFVARVSGVETQGLVTIVTANLKTAASVSPPFVAFLAQRNGVLVIKKVVVGYRKHEATA